MRKHIKRATHQLTVGMRMQLCKDCKDAMRRLCEVDGETCMFHRFVDEDKALLDVNVFVPVSEFRLMRKRFKEDGIVPPGCSTEVVRCTLALVEFPDGTLKKVDPEAVRFLDREKEG